MEHETVPSLSFLSFPGLSVGPLLHRAAVKLLVGGLGMGHLLASVLMSAQPLSRAQLLAAPWA